MREVSDAEALYMAVPCQNKPWNSGAEKTKVVGRQNEGRLCRSLVHQEE